MIDYKFDEPKILDELKNYIDKTYGQHYNTNKLGIQTFENITKIPLRGLYFAVGNIQKYSDRFGEKMGMNRDDLFKCAHYSILALYALDKLQENTKEEKDIHETKSKNNRHSTELRNNKQIDLASER